jgi:hypothetical protein
MSAQMHEPRREMCAKRPAPFGKNLWSADVRLFLIMQTGFPPRTELFQGPTLPKESEKNPPDLIPYALDF